MNEKSSRPVLRGRDGGNTILLLDNLEEALSLKDTDLRRVIGLTKEQLEACKAKGAIIDEDPQISSS
jgi:hypothetical protein